MSRIGIKFEDEILGLLLLNSLPESWETFKISITNSTPNSVVSLQMVKGSVLKEEMRRKTQDSSSQFEVLVSKNMGKSQKREEKIAEVSLILNIRMWSLTTVIKQSIYKNIVSYEKRRTKAKKVNQKRRIMMMMIVSLLLQSVNLVSDESMWIIDNSVILHVIPRKELFTSYTSGDFGVLKIGNDGVTNVIGVGNICLQTNMGMQLWLRGVKHAPDVCFNLIFMHMHDDGERINRTLIERVRCMFSKIRLPKHFWGETLYTAVHVINISLVVALNIKVSNKIWFDKDVKYNHLKVFNCKAFVDVPKDERFKLDMKTRQGIFIGYGHDEYGYRLYDLVEKKLVRNCDVQFMEDQTIEDIDKLGDGFDVPLDDDVEEEQEMSQDENSSDAPKPPPVQLKKSNMERISSTRYTFDEYVTLTNGGEPKCYQEIIESEERQKSMNTSLATHFKLSYGHSPSNEDEKTNMSRVPYASIVGSLMYAMVCTRPDIAHVVGTISSFLSNPGREHWNAVKWILRYLHDTSDLRLFFGGNKPTLVGYSESDMAGDIDSRKSTLGYLIKFIEGVKHVRSCFGCRNSCRSLVLFETNIVYSVIVGVQFILIRDALDAKLLELTKVHTDDNGVNMITKAVPRGKFQDCCEIVGLMIIST
ncbi:hypothetical protein CR513_51740, partial [Mucuna pruriens]